MDNVANVEVVKETLDVEEEEAGSPAAFDAGLDSVCHAQDCIGHCMIVTQAKLAGRKEMKMCSIQ